MIINNALKTIFVCVFALFLVSCSAPNVEHYSKTTPNFDFKTFFSGKLKAYGVVQDFKGELTRKLVVDMNATWQGVIEEDFVMMMVKHKNASGK
jgi:predicted enzyme involved in methoxymalonyl-ACP biosynthesis